MKKENTFFSRLFGSNKPSLQEVKSTTSVSLTSYSQPYVLQQKMKEGHLTHGQTITAHLSPVRLENAFGKTILYFCPMKSIEVLETLSPGDGGAIPGEVKLEALSVPHHLKDGHYTLKNVILTSNGTIQVKATSETLWETTK